MVATSILNVAETFRFPQMVVANGWKAKAFRYFTRIILLASVKSPAVRR